MSLANKTHETLLKGEVNMYNDYLDYQDEIYLDIYLEFGAEAVSDPAYAEELLRKEIA